MYTQLWINSLEITLITHTLCPPIAQRMISSVPCDTPLCDNVHIHYLALSVTLSEYFGDWLVSCLLVLSFIQTEVPWQSALYHHSFYVGHYWSYFDCVTLRGVQMPSLDFCANGNFVLTIMWIFTRHIWPSEEVKSILGLPGAFKACMITRFSCSTALPGAAKSGPNVATYSAHWNLCALDKCMHVYLCMCVNLFIQVTLTKPFNRSQSLSFV